MKKLFFIFILIISLFLSFLSGFFIQKVVSDKETSEIEKLKEENKFCNELNDKLLNRNNPIDKKESECLNKVFSTADSLECSSKSIDEWEKEIDKYLNLLKDKMTSEEYKNIQENQVLWIMQNKSNNEIITKFVFNHGGTMYYQLASSDFVQEKKQRAEFLKWIYDVYTDNIIKDFN